MERTGILMMLICWNLIGICQSVRLNVDATKITVERETSLIGANIEDLNYQLYGGLYSQLLHGECFEEHVDPSEILNIQGIDRLKIWIVIDENGMPALRYFRGAGWGQKASHKPVTFLSPRFGNLKFNSPDLSLDSLPAVLRQRLFDLACGNEQINRHWEKVQTCSASGKYTLTREGAFTGKQAQKIEYLFGEGELGIANFGLWKSGIYFMANKPYEGLLRIKSEKPQQIFLSLRSSSGKILAEKGYELNGKAEEYQRISFELCPSDSTQYGHFVITLKKPGTIIIDYAFLQPGSWGRFYDLSVKKEFAEAILNMGVQSIRYNGSMVNLAVDQDAYLWKNMIAPRDEREPYHGWFNPYASHGFTFFDLLDFSEITGVFPLIGIRDDETKQDVADLIDYCLGEKDTKWGAKRIANGHEKQYDLQAIQIGNEAHPTPEYFRKFKKLSKAIWSKNPDLDVVLSINVGRHDSNPQGFINLIRWAKKIGQEKHVVLDAHYWSDLNHASKKLTKYVGLELHEMIKKELPDVHLRLWPMEENGNKYNWERGLAHAHNLNVMQRMPEYLERAGTANTFQAIGTSLVWNQGRIHFSPNKMIYQPSYFVDRIYADEWLPIVIQTSANQNGVDVLGKKSRDGRILSLYIVNINNEAVDADISLKGFYPMNAKIKQIHGDLDLINTLNKPAAIIPQEINWEWNINQPQIQLPKYSFTYVRFEN